MGWVFPTSGTEEPGAKPDPRICKRLGLRFNSIEGETYKCFILFTFLRFKNKCLKLQSQSEQRAKLGTHLGL